MDKTSALTPFSPTKRTGKQDRELKVLYALVDTYIKTGKAVGSHTLKEAEFEELSSATIRNYFANLEELGYLKQQHSSGGRIPTALGFRAYAQNLLDNQKLSFKESEEMRDLSQEETKKISALLPQAAELLSTLSNHAVFLLSPRYEHDFVTHLKIIPIDQRRALCAILTNFGQVQTEVMHTEDKLSSFSTKRMEEYFHFRLTGQNKPENLLIEEEILAKRWYNELMTRHLVLSSSDESGIYKTGFSRLLTAEEEFDSAIVAKQLATFENSVLLKRLLKESIAHQKLLFWIGEEFAEHSAFIAIPYTVQGHPVGAIGIMGPLRLSYQSCFHLLEGISTNLSQALTKSLIKFKITFKSAKSDEIGKTDYILLDNHT